MKFFKNLSCKIEQNFEIYYQGFVRNSSENKSVFRGNLFTQYKIITENADSVRTLALCATRNVLSFRTNRTVLSTTNNPHFHSVLVL